LEDSTGVLWIGTENGLAFMNSAHIQTPHPEPESLHDPIFGIEEDRAGSLWISTANQVLRVDRDELLRGAFRNVDERDYGLADGLRSTQGVERDRSVVADSLGRIWFSLNQGLSFVDPPPLTRSSSPALSERNRL
jgi:ligand-binding sensor domain-containing protein